LIFPALLKQTARIEFPDPVTGAKIRLTVTPDKVEKVEPSSAVVSWILCPEAANIRGSSCNFQHFFTSPETASKYISQHPGAVILSIDDVHKKIGRFFQEKLN